MRFLLIALMLLCFFSCKKEEPEISITEFIDKYLTCDSVKHSDNGVQKTMIKGRGTGSDIKLARNREYVIYSSTQQKLIYRIINARIYYYPKTGNIHDGDFVKIKSKDGKHLILEHKDIVTKNTDLYYYTSQ